MAREGLHLVRFGARNGARRSAAAVRDISQQAVGALRRRLAPWADWADIYTYHPYSTYDQRDQFVRRDCWPRTVPRDS